MTGAYLEQAKKEKWKKNIKKIRKISSIVVDIVVYPIVVISLFLSTTSLIAKGKGEVQTVFGYTIVSVLSGSMRAAGFEINDSVFLQGFDVTELRPKNEEFEGDIIAFYYYKDIEGVDGAVEITDFDILPEPTSQTPTTSDKTMQDAIENKKPVYFHRIIGVYMAEDGTYFFKTQGDSNNSADAFLIKEDFIVGKYLPVPTFITDSLAYVTTTRGIFIVVVIPLSILVFLQIIEVVTLVFAIISEKKVLSGEIAFDSEESVKAEVGKEMRNHDKVYFYDITPQKDKQRVKDFLWGHLNEESSSDRDKLQYKNVEIAIKMYEKSRDEYWRFWLSQEKSNRMKTKLLNLQRIANILAKTQEINQEHKNTQVIEYEKTGFIKKTETGRMLPMKKPKDISSKKG